MARPEPSACGPASSCWRSSSSGWPPARAQPTGSGPAGPAAVPVTVAPRSLLPGRLSRRGSTGLDLTPEQEKIARALMEKRRPEMEAVLRETFPRFEAIRRQYEADLRPFLTDAQARKLDLHRPEPPPGDARPPADPLPR